MLAKAELLFEFGPHSEDFVRKLSYCSDGDAVCLAASYRQREEANVVVIR